MRFNLFRTDQPIELEGQWYRHFAWLPIFFVDLHGYYTCFWFTHYERMYTFSEDDNGFYHRYFSYRLAGEGDK